jgi:pimeloyl-ACP methyl ester carboxylesterase
MEKNILPPNCEAGMYAGKVPYFKWHDGSKKMIVIESSGDLLRGLSKDVMGRAKMSKAMMVPKGYSFLDLGYNPQMPPNYSMEQVSADFADCIEHEWEPAPVISGSYGGLQAITFAALYPQLCTKLVLISTAHRISEWGINFELKAIERAKQGQMYEAETKVEPIAKRKMVNVMMALMSKLQKKKLLPLYNDGTALVNAFTQCIATKDERKQYLPQIQAPTLILAGDHDQFFDVTAYEETAHLIPNATLKMFKGETHGLVFERAKDLHQIIADFLEK